MKMENTILPIEDQYSICAHMLILASLMHRPNQNTYSLGIIASNTLAWTLHILLEAKNCRAAPALPSLGLAALMPVFSIHLLTAAFLASSCVCSPEPRSTETKAALADGREGLAHRPLVTLADRLEGGPRGPPRDAGRRHQQIHYIVSIHNNIYIYESRKVKIIYNLEY